MKRCSKLLKRWRIKMDRIVEVYQKEYDEFVKSMEKIEEDYQQIY